MTRKPKTLRDGFTTGTAAAAATMAAVELAFTGRAPKTVVAPLPPFVAGNTDPKPGSFLTIPINRAFTDRAPELSGQIWGVPLAFAGVVKDGGDDPDVTSGALIAASVFKGDVPGVSVDGGIGVGRVTLPGLKIPPGHAAINPTPREQITLAARLTLAAIFPDPAEWPPLRIIVSVPEGEELAKQTLNPRLGITGGISILGTRGVSRPYSHAAWGASIIAQIKMAGERPQICLASGRASEALLARRYPDLDPLCFVQAGDMAAAALAAAGKYGAKKIVWGCFFGKLIKLARGMPVTHASRGALDLEPVAKICQEYNSAAAAAVRESLTARAALKIILAMPERERVLLRLVSRAKAAAQKFAKKEVVVHLFDMDGGELITL